VHVRLLAGPAGSGKTFRCLAELRQALIDAPDGPPLILLAPKQTTYQLERQLLAGADLSGFSRLRILSFERLADFVFSQSPAGTPEILDEDGRLMILRALLARRRENFKLFRASARLNGFAQQLSVLLREFQRNQVTPELLASMAGNTQNNLTLSSKLEDLSTILRDYMDWANQQGWQDADFLLTAATNRLAAATGGKQPFPRIAGLWVDGFSEWSLQELELLAALIPHCEHATITFCLAELPQEKISWLSIWGGVQRAFERCRKRLQEISEAQVSVGLLERESSRTRFADNPILGDLEQLWSQPGNGPLENKSPEPTPAAVPNRKKARRRESNQLELGLPLASETVLQALPGQGWTAEQISRALRVAKCSDPETEAIVAAHEILAFVRRGGRFRDVAVLVRDLERYHSTVQRVFARCDIPMFLDRREPVSHHPLAELTRNAIRTVAFDWRETDWFAALKTGLLPAREEEIDELENEALARGWRGRAWNERLRISESPNRPRDNDRLRNLEQRLEKLRLRIIPPFQKIATAVRQHRYRLTGAELAAAIRELWQDLRVEQTLQKWLERDSQNSFGPAPESIHATVWDQMNRWLANVELAFPTEGLSLREWLPILEAGLTSLTVGLIPPALDQVTIGTIERSRNPEVKLAIVLGLNEGVFPEMPITGGLLTDGDRTDLEKFSLPGNLTARQRLSHERYLAYIAFTRARQRLVLTYSVHDANAKALNPSPFIDHLLRLFPALKTESITPELDWRDSQAPYEMVEPLLLVEYFRRQQKIENRTLEPATITALQNWQRLSGLPTLRSVLQALRHFDQGPAGDSILPNVAAELYGPILNTSVSRMEHFAACPFKFFVNSGLRAEAREVFELDVKEQGSFQHDALAEFHSRLRAEGKRWRDVTPREARERMAADANRLAVTYRDGLLQATEQSQFMARALSEALQNFVEMLVGWMGSQYKFDPVAVELPFGHDETSPAWQLSLSQDRRIAIYGRIDRVDLFQPLDSDTALCVVVDYKSSQKLLDPVLMAHGAQLQLLTYLNVLRTWKNPENLFNARQLTPSGVFYVNLSGRFPGSVNRNEAQQEADENRKRAYRHAGRFDLQFLRLLDARQNVFEGDQFNYKLKKDGTPTKRNSDVMAPAEFRNLLDTIEANLKSMGEQIYNGVATISPYQKGQLVACNQCDYQAICRIDPWTHEFRVLR
jgi:ATP-dependent helicase/nuclease subunit B